ncbi:PorT family protein [Aquimarina sp. AD10]|uniref:Outer membrane protein beta-barrel domain-containing protein n=1 Tax=Aquimarina aggregata TaxID=1642818 RepID=A0A162YUP1_9FLAO|nr:MULTISPECIES: porin family protein [Aquimarina]AXT61269.1 PorT family protein [Aquimarina sp. AD10]KZS39365.1 hypothetical protein AWE51_12545 [Aquimarina aggregata]RKN01536.1 PorT family protein [Aquimarina sp. AD10]
MKNVFLFVLCFISALSCFGQEIDVNQEEKKVLDSLYREDQFYVAVTYNFLLNTPSGFSQSDFSGGIHMGYTRDMPINKRRNIAIGLGLGYSVNLFNHNLFIGEEENTEQSIFNRLNGVDFKRNRFNTHLVEAPLEFRWRTSVPETHKFYRIYTGLRVGYLYHFSSNFDQGDLQVRQTKIDELERWRFGATFTFGWNTFNFHFYYSLNTLFDKNALIDDSDKVNLNPVKVGLIFYIL